MSVSSTEAEERMCPMRPDECDSELPVEPEFEDGLRYWECPVCQFSWGYEKVEEGVQIEGNCQIGVPEDVRRAHSAPMQKALAEEQRKQPVDLGLTIGRRPSE